jgi:hypothetical protein
VKPVVTEGISLSSPERAEFDMVVRGNSGLTCGEKLRKKTSLVGLIADLLRLAGISLKK